MKLILLFSAVVAAASLHPVIDYEFIDEDGFEILSLPGQHVPIVDALVVDQSIILEEERVKEPALETNALTVFTSYFRLLKQSRDVVRFASSASLASELIQIQESLYDTLNQALMNWNEMLSARKREQMGWALYLESNAVNKHNIAKAAKHAIGNRLEFGLEVAKAGEIVLLLRGKVREVIESTGSVGDDVKREWM